MDLIRSAFESTFGPMPPNCTWTGSGFCQTSHHAWKAQEYADKFIGFKVAWQAARRAQVVPQFSQVSKKKLDYLLEAGEVITGYAIENKDGRRGAIDCHGFVYWWQEAAAPQPPEAAPVQMPEPVAVAFRFETEENGPTETIFYPNDRIGMGWTALYTEHQVRQLLSDHGIK